MALRASNKYLAGTEGPHNISSCHLLYSRLVIWSSSSSSSSSSSVKICPSSNDYFIMAGVDITLHGYYYYLNRWHILFRERGDFEIFNIYVVRTHTIRGPQPRYFYVRRGHQATPALPCCCCWQKPTRPGCQKLTSSCEDTSRIWVRWHWEW